MKKTILLTIGILLACTPLFSQGLHISNWSNSSSGTANTFPAGDTIFFSFSVENQDAFAHQNCEISIATLNPNIEFLDSLETFEYIGAGNQYQFNNSFKLVVSPATPNGQVITFTIHIKSDQWQHAESLVFSISSCNIIFSNYAIIDNNNRDALINASETDSILFTLQNEDFEQVFNVDFVLRTNEPNISIESGTLHKDSILSQEIFTFPTQIQANNSFVDGTTFDVFIDILINGHVQNTLIVSIIGIDNAIRFEDNNDVNLFSNPLNFPGWQIDSTVAHSGLQSLKSGPISHYDTSAVQYDFTAIEDGIMSFEYKVSSESNYDFLYFYLDGVQVVHWSGELDWGTFQYPVPAGQHTAMWAYIKDKSVSYYSDCAWIDDIRIPNNTLTQATFTVPTTAIERTLDRVHNTSEDIVLPFSNTYDSYILFANRIVSDDDNLIGWASVSPANGSVNAHQQRDITLHLTAEEQMPGDYHAFLEIRIEKIDSTIRIPLTLHVQSLDGIDDIVTSVETNIYPNPTHGRFTISSETEEIQSVRIYDVTGKLILWEQINNSQGEIDLNGQSKGIYFLKIETSKGISTQKIILQ